MEDTIAAIATAPGEGSIGVIRVSGSESIEVVDRIFSSPSKKKLINVETFTLTYGSIFDPVSGQVVDEVLVSVMKGPRSFTAENVVEVNCHGGMVPLKKCLDLILTEGVRLADPGEFTKRAFLNGRIDLAQAESVIDVIRAKTDVSLQVALNQLKGSISREVKEIRFKILEILAYLEASIDFPDDEIEALSEEDIRCRVAAIADKLSGLLASADSGRILREGLNVAIIGKPNVGKSSLLNALLKDNRAIVTDIPGTTRDVIEEYINIQGVPVKIIDTAGIRTTEDLVEQIGVEKSRQALNQADLVLMVVDVTDFDQQDSELLELVKNRNVMLILNKIDLVAEGVDLYLEEFGDLEQVRISVKNEFGLKALEDQIVNFVWNKGISNQSELLIANSRHKDSMNKALKAIQEVEGGLKAGMPGDFLSIDLKGAWEHLGEITGDTVGEDIIDEIFSRFCLGK